MIVCLQRCCQAHRRGRTLFSTIIPGHLHIFGLASALGLGIYRYKLHQTGGECFWQAGVSVLIGACSAVDIGLVEGYHLASIQGVLEL